MQEHRYSDAAAARRSVAALTALALASTVGACAKGDIVGGNTVQMADVAVPSDSFLPQPGLLAQNPGTLWNLTYTKPGFDIGSYSGVYIAPVTIITGTSSALAGLPPDQRDALANTLYSDIAGTVGASCRVARARGPGIITLNVALSNAKASDPVVKTVATYAPYASTAYSLGSRVFNNGVGYFSGTATAEAYATDGRTNALLWQGVDKRGGNVPMVQDTADQWLDVHNAFVNWAEQLVTKMQQSGMCKARTQT